MSGCKGCCHAAKNHEAPEENGEQDPNKIWKRVMSHEMPKENKVYLTIDIYGEEYYSYWNGDRFMHPSKSQYGAFNIRDKWNPHFVVLLWK